MTQFDFVILRHFRWKSECAPPCLHLFSSIKSTSFIICPLKSNISLIWVDFVWERKWVFNIDRYNLGSFSPFATGHTPLCDWTCCWKYVHLVPRKHIYLLEILNERIIRTKQSSFVNSLSIIIVMHMSNSKIMKIRCQK